MSSGKEKTYNVRLSTKSAKYLTSLDRTTATRILDKLELLKIDPHHSPGIKQLTGQLAGLYRLRIGNFRAVYKVDEDGFVVIVLIIGPRGDVYK